MNTSLVVLPLLIPFATALLMLLLLGRPRPQRVLGVLASALLLASGVVLLAVVRQQGVQVLQLGSWPAPIGISFVADLFSASMITITGVVALAVSIYSLTTVDRRYERFGYHPLTQLLLFGVCGAFLTGDIFNLFVWFEVMLIASFVLLALGGRPMQLEGGVKYVTLNLLSSVVFLTAVGLLYGLAGTLNMAQLAERVSASPDPTVFTPVAVLLIVAFGTKAGLFPLFFWLPASYHTPPIMVTALFAGLLTKVGVYALVRMFTLIFVEDVAFTHTVLMVLAGITMLTGVLGAMVQNDVRRLLSFHIISQIGYMVLGLAFYTPLALAGAIFFVLHNILTKTNLFLIAGIAARMEGSYNLKYLGGLWSGFPLLGFIFLASAMSLAGLPPLSGFFAKLAIVQAGLEVGQYVWVALALLVSIFTLFSMTKIWAQAFWKPKPDVESGLPDPRASRGAGIRTMLIPTSGLAIAAVVMGLVAGPIFAITQEAAIQLLDRQQYITSVLGAG